MHQTQGNRQIKTTWSEIGNESGRDSAYSVTAVSAACDMITIRMHRKFFDKGRYECGFRSMFIS